MGNIVLLDELTINKIAAGEVIERPASVVKEMIENSIDAGATNINIEIQNGGISKIRITDNGKGIAADDMKLAFERHATSKIRVADDLEIVRTMGFRGEALASIAAISRIEMTSRTRDSQTGYKMIVEAGNIIKEEIAGCQVGTTINVEKLFFNTPVRYKFLKKDYTEAGYIEDAITRLALINPDIAIKLINSGKTIIQTSGNGDIKDVIYGIYGKEIAEGTLEVNYEFENIKVSGVVGKPEIARSNKTNQMFFVNKRFVKDKILSAATDKAFKGMLPIGKFGFLILNIDMTPKKVDVNVHPAKLEVRFSDEGMVFKAVMYAIKEGLLSGSLVSNISSFDAEKVEENEIKGENLEKGLETNLATGIEINSIEGIGEEVLVVPEELKNKEKKSGKSIIDLFRKVSKDVESNNLQVNSDNLIEDLYNKKRVQQIGINDLNEKAEINSVQKENEENENIDLSEIFNIPKETHKLEEGEILAVKEGETTEIPVIMQVEMEAEQKAELKVEQKIEPKAEQKTDDDIPNTVKEMAKEYNQENKTLLNTAFEEMYEKTFGEVPASLKRKELKFDDIKYANNINMSSLTKKNAYPTYKYIGTAFSTYIMLEIGDELYLLDQHAAHERIMYEKVKANFYNGDKDSQLMLLPDVIKLTNKEIWVVRENIETFEKAGFSLEEFGDDTIKLMGVPNICMELDTKTLFLDILDEIDTVARTERQEIEEKFIATIACKSAVKGKMYLEEAEILALLENLMMLPNPFTCPHGRPTAIKMTKADIEKKFSRR